MIALRHDWKELLLRAWSVRVAAFWGAFGALLTLLAVIGPTLPIWVFGPALIFMSVTFAIARVTHQPGTD